MENIVINGYLYKCANGTNDKIKKALRIAENRPDSERSNGQAYENFIKILGNIMANKIGLYIENVYQTD